MLAAELNQIAFTRGGGPAVLRLDNGPEMIAAALAEWAGARTGMIYPARRTLEEPLHRVL